MELFRKFQIRSHILTRISQTAKTKILTFISHQNNHYSLLFFSSYFLNYYAQP